MAPGTQSVALYSKLAIDRGEGSVFAKTSTEKGLDLLAGVWCARGLRAHPKYVAGRQRQDRARHVGSFLLRMHRAAMVELIRAVTPATKRHAVYSRRRGGGRSGRAASALATGSPS